MYSHKDLMALPHRYRYDVDGQRVREPVRSELVRRRSLSPVGPVVSSAYYSRRSSGHHGYYAGSGFANYEDTRTKLVELQRRLELIKRDYTVRCPGLRGSAHVPVHAQGYRAIPTSSHPALAESEWYRPTTPVHLVHSPYAEYYNTVSTVEAQMNSLKHEIAALQHRVSSKDATIHSMMRNEDTLRHENQRLHSMLDGIDHRLESLRTDLDTDRWM